MMTALTPRLGDLIDDHCPRCKLLLNHAIASLMDGKVAKVICQTCLTEHPYLHADGAKRKKPAGGRQTLFEQVLAHTAPTAEAEAKPVKKKKAAGPARYSRRHSDKSLRASR